MSDCHEIKTGVEADNVLELAMQKLLFLGAAIPGDGVADDVLGFDAACGLAGILKEIAEDLDSVRDWQHTLCRRVADSATPANKGTRFGA